MASGHKIVVDVDLEKFFDRVNHDVLMRRVAHRIEDKRLVRVIRGFLNAGMMLNGVVIERHEGTPQGGPLSPLLANLRGQPLGRTELRARTRCEQDLARNNMPLPSAEKRDLCVL